MNKLHCPTCQLWLYMQILSVLQTAMHYTHHICNSESTLVYTAPHCTLSSDQAATHDTIAGRKHDLTVKHQMFNGCCKNCQWQAQNTVPLPGICGCILLPSGLSSTTSKQYPRECDFSTASQSWQIQTWASLVLPDWFRADMQAPWSVGLTDEQT